VGGYNVTKRVSLLRKQVDESRAGQWGLRRTVVLSVILIGLAVYLTSPSRESNTDTTEDSAEIWYTELQQHFSERVSWLESSPLALMPGSAALYAGFGKAVVSIFDPAPKKKPADELELIDLTDVRVWFSQMATGAILRLGFVLIAFWPLWVMSVIAGIFVVRRGASAARSKTVLGVCDRARSPFYSGIYGPFRPNNSFSGTDFSCPGLACPPMAARNTALEHKLIKILREYDAFNETNLDLARIILAHSDFPGHVDEEGSDHEEPDQKGIAEDEQERVSQTGFVTNESGTLEQQTINGLSAVLEAHRRITGYVKSLEDKKIKSSVLNSNYPVHLANLEKLSASASALTKLLIMSLTPNRIWASSHLNPQLVASAYLAIEAGKSLVYKRHASGFVRVSIFPHLQARAVVNSLNSYHAEYNGDQRLIIRQAIICSRRHGDFGRAFLPTRMPVESRVVRDWLEILYAEPDKLQDTGYLVELDAHIEEINMNWRIGFAKRLRQEVEVLEKTETLSLAGNLWKGIAYKSVVLLPVKSLVEIALRGIHEARKKRITELLALTRRYQTRISISARLPGFKRQALEADKSGEDSDRILEPNSDKEDAELTERWRIVRRMLTKYNWLSTRVGDDAVPITGLVSALLQSEEDAKQAVDLDALVPLRQRRFVELFGRAWESIYYSSNPNPEDLEIFVDREKFADAIKAAGRAQNGGGSAAENSKPEPSIVSV